MSDHGFPAQLQGFVWHTTSPARYRQIVESGAIVPNPDIPDAERWKTGNGPDTYPYVRVLGGVSLFEFIDFDPISYTAAYPMSMWRNFVPCCVKWDAAMWLQIDVQSLGRRYTPSRELVARWKSEGAWKHTIMPHIEAASLSPIPVASIRRVLECSRPDLELRQI